MTRLIAICCLVALAGAGAASAGERAVTITGLRFDPQIRHVIVGDTVRWTNKDSREHDVRSNDGIMFESGVLKFNEPFVSPAFTAAGDVPYHCEEHLIMTGTVRVHEELWLAGPSGPVLWGNAARLNGLAPEGTNVEIERFEGSAWTLFDTVVANAEDAFSLTVPTVPGQYRAATTTDTTAAVTVVVRPRVALAKKRLKTKRTRLTVTATPNRTGAVAVLQRRKPAGWSPIASKRLASNSKAVFTIRPKKGTWRVRALVKASGGYAANQSGVIAVKR